MTKLTINKHTLETSHEEKILFPKSGITKGEIVDYYRNITEMMVPLVKDRPLTMFRYPNGIQSQGFVQQQASTFFPRWMERAAVEREKGETIEHVLCNNPETIIYLANQACITFHVWLSRVDKIEYPDRLIFDLDPWDEDFEVVRFAALEFRKILEDDLGLKCFPMTTGSHGLHVTAPISRLTKFDDVRTFARKVAGIMINRYPDIMTGEIRKGKRKGRLFIDINRNAYGQTAVAPYSVRAIEGAPVATPIDWSEVENKKLNSQSFNIRNIFNHLGRRKNPWRDIHKIKGSLAQAQKRLAKIKP